MNKFPMTPVGYKKLRDKLRYLKKVERPNIVMEIEIAREKGDLSENAEYDAAKEKQGLVNQQIKELEHKLSLAQVIEPSTIKSDKITFGSTVTLIDIDNDEELVYSIVGSDEMNISKGWISIESPIARSMIGKEEGDEIKVKTPRGIRNFEIASISYKSLK